MFTFTHMANGKISCKVILPNSVDSSVREFCSTDLWITERWARLDAAFEAYVGLYRVGLVNDNLLPLPHYDEEAARAYAEVRKRPAVTLANEKYKPWPALAAAWRSISTVYQSVITILREDVVVIRMKMIAPFLLPQISTFTLYVNAQLSLSVSISEGVETAMEADKIAAVNEATRILLQSVFPTKMSSEHQHFLLLFSPDEHWGGLESWLKNVRGTFDYHDLRLGVESPAAIGLVRDSSKPNKAYAFHGIEHRPRDYPEDQSKFTTDLGLKVKAFSKRTDFLHRIPADAAKKKEDFVFVSPQNCCIDRLPIIYSQFAMWIPSIMHRVETVLLTEHLCTGLLAPIGLSTPDAALPAICTPAAREESDYQRLEFLGDAILKMLASSALMADHPTWHEGYLSRAKDHIVSNGRLALAAQRITLDRYILTKSFTGKKWKPLCVDRPGNPNKNSQRKLSTKTIADVVEALIGVAFLDGGFCKALSCLQILLPEESWLPLAERNNMLLRTVLNSTQASGIPPNLANLETLLGHTFIHRALLLEAVTHPSHMSIPSTPSYQRLEYLGDALLDFFVTKTIFSHQNLTRSALRPHDMHTIRATAVNASFLAYRSLAHTIPIVVSKFAPSSPHELPSLVPSARQVSIPSFLRHAPIPALTSALQATRSRFTILASTIDTALSHGSSYPWRALAAFAPEKVFSDLIEAVLGAIYVDTNGDLKACHDMLRKIGIMDWVETALDSEVQIRHPKGEVGRLARNEKVRFQVWVENKSDRIGQWMNLEEETLALGEGKYRCKVSVGGEEICVVQGWNKLDVEIAAAEQASLILRSR